MPLTEEWHAMRKLDFHRNPPVVFGASEAAAVCGRSPYQGPLSIYMRKREEIASMEDSLPMKVGRALEGTVLDLYAEIGEHKLIRGLPMYFHPRHAFMAATPDAIALREGAFGDQPHELWEHAVDAKCSTYRRYDEFADEDSDKFGAAGTDVMPEDYIFQAQQQMAVLGLDRVDFPVLFDARTLRTYSVERNDTIIDAIVMAEQELAERVVNGDPPEPNWEADGTRALLLELHGFKAGVRAQLGEQEVAWWVEHQRLKQEIDEREERRKELKNRILHAMAGAEAGLFPSGQRQLKRSQVKESVWSHLDVEEARKKIGTVKRKGSERLLESKVK